MRNSKRLWPMLFLVAASRIGRTLRPTYSFVSMTEISEYVLTAEQYAQRLARRTVCCEVIIR